MELVKSLILLLVVIGLSVSGMYCLKSGMIQVGVVELDSKINYFQVLMSIASKPFIWIGMSLYFISALLWMVVLSRVDLSYAYPMLSLSYVAVFIISALKFGEHITPLRIAGAVLICLGVVLVSRS